MKECNKDEFIRELMNEIYEGRIKMCRCLYLENIRYLYTFLWNNFKMLKFTKRGNYLFLELRFDIKRLIRKEGYEVVVYTRSGKKRWGTMAIPDAINMYTRKESERTIYPVWVGNVGELGVDLESIIDYYVTCKNTPVIALEKRLSAYKCADLNSLVSKLYNLQK